MSEPYPPTDDPVFRHARREALVILGLWLTCLLYTLTVCYFWGYNRDPATLTDVWGIPDWVFYGIFFPWAFCDLFTIWFCFFHAKEDDLGAGEAVPGTTPDLGGWADVRRGPGSPEQIQTNRGSVRPGGSDDAR
jgi:hypothetical protein